MDQVIAHYPKVKGVGSDQRRSGVVHRLDKEASGVLIFAKHDKALQHLKDQFKQRLTDKHYVALVQGKMLANNGSIDFPIARSANRGRMAARPKSQTGKEALTHYQVIQHFTTSTLVDVEIYTGRTHQIRAHLFALGHPLVGDKLYTRKGLKPTTLNRLFLHAKELSLTLPSGEKQTFSCPLPQELQDFLANLKTIR
jgi:23S rRNA pseudouridine1911/1915/1917 synthase